MSLRDDHAGLMDCARTRDRSHSHSSGVGGMCAHNPSEQARARKVIAQDKIVFLVKTITSLGEAGLSFISCVLIYYVG